MRGFPNKASGQELKATVWDKGSELELWDKRSELGFRDKRLGLGFLWTKVYGSFVLVVGDMFCNT